MALRHVPFLIALLPAVLAAQNRGGIVEVSPFRTLTLPASQAIFTINVNTASTAAGGVGSVVGALQELGLKADEHLIRVSANSTPQYEIQPEPAPPSIVVTYEFQLDVPFSQFESVSAALERFAAKPPKPIEQLGFQARVQPSAAAAEEARLKLLPELFQEARREAERQLSEAGQTPGTILYLADEIRAGYGTTATIFALFLRMAALGDAAALQQNRSVAVWARERPSLGPRDVAVFRVLARLKPGETRASTVELVKPLGLSETELVSQAIYANAFPGFGGANGPGAPAERLAEFAATRPASEFAGFLAKFAALSAANPTAGLQVSAELSYSPTALTPDSQRATAPLLATARRRAEPLAGLLNLPLRSPRLLTASAYPLPSWPQALLSARPGALFGLLAPANFDQRFWHSLIVEFALD